MSDSAPVKGVVFRMIPALLVLGALELGLRALDLPAFDACWHVKETFWQPEPDPELGWRYRPGSVIGPATLNQHGWRGPILEAEKAPGRYRILYIGDSTCFGLGVALEDSFAARSAAGIQRDRPGQIVEYQIGALPGYSSHHSRVLTRRLLPLHPDLVVFYVGGHNDHSRGRYFPDGDIPVRLARREQAWHGFGTARLLENLVDYAYRKWFRKLRSDAAKARVPPDDFHANVRDMVERTRAAGAVPLILSPPFSKFMQEDHPIFPLYQEALADVAAEQQALLVDLQRHFTRYDDDEVYFRDGFHFSPLGHRVAGEQIRLAVAAERRRPLTP